MTGKPTRPTDITAAPVDDVPIIYVRGHETQIAARVFADFRNHMWPILGHTTFDAKRVIDWAVTDLAQPDVIAGGVSMGGDIAVALAGIDTRVRRVAAIVATPDWSRPGMCELFDRPRLVDQGHAGPAARSFHDRLDPKQDAAQSWPGLAPSLTAHRQLSDAAVRLTPQGLHPAAGLLRYTYREPWLSDAAPGLTSECRRVARRSPTSRSPRSHY